MINNTQSYYTRLCIRNGKKEIRDESFLID